MSTATMAPAKGSKSAKKKRSSFIRETLARTIKSPGAKLGAVLLAVIILACLTAPLYCPWEPNHMDTAHALEGPSSLHWFGTDKLGRDLFTRIMYGGRYSLSLGLFATLLGSCAGISLGCVAGYFGGKVEAVIMRLMDIWTAIPGTLLCIMISAVLGPGFFNTVLALAIGRVPGGVRMIRAQILRERTREYIEAAHAINCSKPSIMFKHLLPNVISPQIVSITMGIGGTLTQASGLSYIGLGVQPPTPEWGALLSAGRSYVMTQPYLILFPGLVIALVVLSFNLLGDGLRDALDPRLRT